MRVAATRRRSSILRQPKAGIVSSFRGATPAPFPALTFPTPTPTPDDAGVVPARVLAVAHRGASRDYRENTLAAFARALELGADAIELDVRVTRDGRVVVHHDADVQWERDGTVSARRRTIDRLTLAEVRAVDLGGGARIPTLDEVMELVAGRAEVFVELKRPVVADPVVACLGRHRRPYALHSFDHDAIARLAATAPHIRRGILFDDPLHDPAVELAAHLARTGARDVWPRYDLASPALVDVAHALGARVIAWTVNDVRAGVDLVAMGIDGVCSDDVRWMRASRDAGVASPVAAASSTLAPPQMPT